MDGPRAPALRRGFSLVEILVIIAIVATLAGLLLPAIQQVRAAAARAKCQNNLKQLALANLNFHDQNEQFPAAFAVSVSPPDPTLQAWYGPWSGNQYSTWVAPLMPYLEQGNLYTDWMTNPQSIGWGTNGGPSAPNAAVLPTLICPADAIPSLQYQVSPPAAGYPDGVFIGVCSYGVNYGTQEPPTYPTPLVKDGIFHYNSTVRLTDITDGTSTTILMGERSNFDPQWSLLVPGSELGGFYSGWIFGGWYLLRQPLVEINYLLPASVATSPPPAGSSIWSDLVDKRLYAYGSLHSGGCHMAFCDGSVQFVGENMTLVTLAALSTRSGGEPITDY